MCFSHGFSFMLCRDVRRAVAKQERLRSSSLSPAAGRKMCVQNCFFPVFFGVG